MGTSHMTETLTSFRNGIGSISNALPYDLHFLYTMYVYPVSLLYMPEMTHDWLNKNILFYSILFCINPSSF